MFDLGDASEPTARKLSPGFLSDFVKRLLTPKKTLNKYAPFVLSEKAVNRSKLSREVLGGQVLKPPKGSPKTRVPGPWLWSGICTLSNRALLSLDRPISYNYSAQAISGPIVFCARKPHQQLLMVGPPGSQANADFATSISSPRAGWSLPSAQIRACLEGNATHTPGMQ